VPISVHNYCTQYSKTFLIIFPLILQRIIIAQMMLSTGGEGAHAGTIQKQCVIEWLPLVNTSTTSNALLPATVKHRLRFISSALKRYRPASWINSIV